MTIVMKFGGTSVATTAHIQRVAARALAAQAGGEDVVVVVSAMSGETDRLLGLGRSIAGAASRRELDALAATGEQVTAALTAIAIQAAGGASRSFQAHQLRLLTDSDFGDATVLSVGTQALHECFAAGEIPVVAGFQGVDANGNVTTLGRGGSDTTAVAVAAALKADVCDIYTDVDGVYDADPRTVTGARKFPALSYEAMYALARSGAKVLHDKSVALAARHGVPLRVLSTFIDAPGTWVGRRAANSLDTSTKSLEVFAP